MNELGPNLPSGWCQAQPIRISFSPQNGFITETLLSFISCPGGWSQTIPQVKKPDVEALGWCGYTWAGVVIRGLLLWSRLDILPNSLKQCWRCLMVEKLTFNILETALVDIPAVSMPIARSLKTWDICGIVLCDKSAHFWVAFYCPQDKVHLCNDHST